MEESPVIPLSVCASAPGKVILFGEHAVVYGEPAVAAALSDLRIFVQITCTDTGTVRMFLPDLPTPIDYSLRSEKLTVGLDSLQTPPTAACASTIAKLFDPSSSSSSSDAQQHPEDSFTVAALTPLIYLLHHLAPTDMLAAGLEIRVRSQDLPVGAGLGSSAAFGVASAAALVLLSLSAPPSSNAAASNANNQAQTRRVGRPDPVALEKIDQYAYYSEILLHGTPSGIDNAVSSHGGAIHFTKSQESGGKVTMKHLDNVKPLDLLLVYTHVPRSTKELVAGVRARHEQYPATRIMLQAMGATAQQFQTWWCSSDSGSAAGDVLTMVRTNQHLLAAVGVSHASLNRICAVVDETAGDEAAAKLTGAGGGGCAFVVLRPSSKPDGNGNKPGNLNALRRKIQRALQAAQHPWKFTCLQSSVGGDGVVWLSPTNFPADEETSLLLSVVSWWARYAAVAVLITSTCAFTVMTRQRRSTTASR